MIDSEFADFIRGLKVLVDASIPGGSYIAHGHLCVQLTKELDDKKRLRDCVIVDGRDQRAIVTASPGGRQLSVSVSSGVRVYRG